MLTTPKKRRIVSVLSRYLYSSASPTYSHVILMVIAILTVNIKKSRHNGCLYTICRDTYRGQSNQSISITLPSSITMFTIGNTWKFWTVVCNGKLPLHSVPFSCSSILSHRFNRCLSILLLVDSIDSISSSNRGSIGLTVRAHFKLILILSITFLLGLFIRGHRNNG